MPALVIKKPETRIGRPLKVLVPLIQEELAAGASAGLAHYRRAGEMLLEARGQVEEYRWGTWLSKNFELSRTTAWRYIRLAEHLQEDSDPVSLRNLQTQLHGNQTRKAWAKVATAAREIDRELFGQERQTTNDELQLLREIALELIDLGYRALATRLHPDQGGSKVAMQRLHRVRDALKSFAKHRRFV